MFVGHKVGSARIRFKNQLIILMWKSFLQRKRKWRLLVTEVVFAIILFVLALFQSRPVFLTPTLDTSPPLSSQDILDSLNKKTYLGYAPLRAPFESIMERASELLKIPVRGANTKEDLEGELYKDHNKKGLVSYPVVWVIWTPREEFENDQDYSDIWRFSIRSIDRQVYRDPDHRETVSNCHLRTGFLAIQMAISDAILQFMVPDLPKYEINLKPMPVSPLMLEDKVRNTISWTLLFFTIALLPPVLDIVCVVVNETTNGYKRALRLRQVGYMTMYFSWLCYAYLTVIPISLIAAIFLIFMFRWIQMYLAIVFVLSYVTVMIMLVFNLAMFHKSALFMCLSTTIVTALMTYWSELLVQYKYDFKLGLMSMILHVIVPPLGLVNGFNHFAMLHTYRGASLIMQKTPLSATILAWDSMSFIYFGLLMLLQRTIGQDRAIGGQMTWKSAMFRKSVNPNRLHYIRVPSGKEREKLQEVDELVAKAISLQNVSKTIMGQAVLRDVTFDIYRGEYTLLYAEKNQESMIRSLEDLISGLASPDSGTINVLGHNMDLKVSFLTVPHMMGYCHDTAFLIQDLTVQEHVTLFLQICLWNESSQYLAEYEQIRLYYLLEECDLTSVSHVSVKNLSVYYQAQLCWALALLLEPRIVMLPKFTENSGCTSIFIDKIMRYKGNLTIIQSSLSPVQLEYADRVFLFDHKHTVFGGTPAYLFFKYGRDYRIGLTMRMNEDQEQEHPAELLANAIELGAKVRGSLGSVLLLLQPVSPTKNVALLLRHITQNASTYGVTSMKICLADSEEVGRRAILESRKMVEDSQLSKISRAALSKIEKSEKYSKKKISFLRQLRCMGWKTLAFNRAHKFFLTITMLAGMVLGIMLAQSLTALLTDLYAANKKGVTGQGHLLTVEALEVQKTTLMIKCENTSAANSIATAYAFSDKTVADVSEIKYTAVTDSDSLMNYLSSMATHKPQEYVYMYAYGIDVSESNGIIYIHALYSPVHIDQAASARSLARVYMALARHFTKVLDANIHVVDHPLTTSVKTDIKDTAVPLLLIQAILVFTVSHITILPSKEAGLIRHMQMNASHFSPHRYWFLMFFYDFVQHAILVVIMTYSMIGIMRLIIPWSQFKLVDMTVIQTVLMFYGLACIPQAYLFSLGPYAPLNFSCFYLVNIIFAESTINVKMHEFKRFVWMMYLSPQYSVTYAFVKIKKIFIYNSECQIYRDTPYCDFKTLHKCCKKCGVINECFEKLHYFSMPGVYMELLALLFSGILYTVILFLWEYRVIPKLLKYIETEWIFSGNPEGSYDTTAVRWEKERVINKMKQIMVKYPQDENLFGKGLLVNNMSYQRAGEYYVDGLHFGLGEGEVLELAGFDSCGTTRLQYLCELLAGYKLPSSGDAYVMSKWSLMKHPHRFAMNASLSSSEKSPLPTWMGVKSALEYLGLLRGVPVTHLHTEVQNYIDALGLREKADDLVSQLSPAERTSFHFAAAVVGAPQVVVFDDCVSHQDFMVRRAMYSIMNNLRKRGHSVVSATSSVKSYSPLSDRLAVILHGRMYEVDRVDHLRRVYGNRGYTVVLHLKDEIDVRAVFREYFHEIVVNDTTEVLVNVEILDDDLEWAEVFDRMEKLLAEHKKVYSYIVASIPLDLIYNSIILKESWSVPPVGPSPSILETIFKTEKKKPDPRVLAELKYFKPKCNISKLDDLPWSVIFQR